MPEGHGSGMRAIAGNKVTATAIRPKHGLSYSYSQSGHCHEGHCVVWQSARDKGGKRGGRCYQADIKEQGQGAVNERFVSKHLQGKVEIQALPVLLALPCFCLVWGSVSLVSVCIV